MIKKNFNIVFKSLYFWAFSCSAWVIERLQVSYTYGQISAISGQRDERIDRCQSD